MKAQSAIEFMTTYAWAFLIIAIFIGVIVVLVTVKNPSEYSPSSCYLTPEFYCTQSIFLSNSTASTFAVLFVNRLGAPIKFSTSPFLVYPSISNYSYIGNCLPSYLPKDGLATCIAKISKPYSVGVQINPNFKITYSVCQNYSSCTQTYNTSGSASDLVAYSKALFSNLTILTNTGTGNVILDGVPYPSNTVLTLVNNLQYSIYAQPPSGHSFNSWSASNVFISNALSQSTTIYLTASGSLKAQFQ